VLASGFFRIGRACCNRPRWITRNLCSMPALAQPGARPHQQGGGCPAGALANAQALVAVADEPISPPINRSALLDEQYRFAGRTRMASRHCSRTIAGARQKIRRCPGQLKAMCRR